MTLEVTKTVIQVKSFHYSDAAPLKMLFSSLKTQKSIKCPFLLKLSPFCIFEGCPHILGYPL